MRSKQILAIALAASLAYGSVLWATTYPTSGGSVTASSTNTFTNKTIDANGTGNSITNIDMTADVTGTLPVANGGTASTAVGRWVLLSTLTASNDATLDFETSIGSTYDQYMLVINNLLPITDDDALWIRVKVSTYQSDSTDYSYNVHRVDAAATHDVGVSTGAAQLVMTQGVGNGTGEGIDGVLYFSEPDATSFKRFYWNMSGTGTSASSTHFVGSGQHDGGTDAITGVQFLFSSANLSTGVVAAYGLVK